jgi:hypothetical protein
MNITPRDVVVVSMLWLGLLVFTSRSWWKPVRNFVEGKTH